MDKRTQWARILIVIGLALMAIGMIDPLEGAMIILPDIAVVTMWVEEVRQRRGDNIAAVALAAKHARILWALLAGGQEYRVAA